MLDFSDKNFNYAETFCQVIEKFVFGFHRI
jgi:hypothetical protein